MERPMYVTYLAGVFRSLRFGTSDAHGKGMALQFNYLIDAGAFQQNESTGTFTVNFEKIKEGVRKLTGEIMTAQAEGNYAKAKEMLDHGSVIRPEVQRVLDRMSTIPIDIAPEFPLTR
jgi:hypothetical protein